MTILVRDRVSGRQHFWTTVGPTENAGNDAYLVVGDHHPAFNSVAQMVYRLLRESREFATRQIACTPIDDSQTSSINRATVEEIAEGNQSHWPDLTICSLEPHGTITRNQTSCLPTAICVVRSEYSGREVVILKKRTVSSSTDDLGKLSLMSSRVLEEEVAEALGVPLTEEMEAGDAIDAMRVSRYRLSGDRGPLVVPRSAFIRAAQREMFFSCGMDLPEERFTFRGCQVVNREDSDEQIFFCIFEVILLRQATGVSRHGIDEYLIAMDWNGQALERVYQEEIYTSKHRSRLNRLLDRREQWLREAIFSQPFSAFP